MLPRMSAWYVIDLYACMCKQTHTRLNASYVWLQQTSDARSALESICQNLHRAFYRVASIKPLDTIGSQQTRFSAAEIDDVKKLFTILLYTRALKINEKSVLAK